MDNCWEHGVGREVPTARKPGSLRKLAPAASTSIHTTQGRETFCTSSWRVGGLVGSRNDVVTSSAEFSCLGWDKPHMALHDPHEGSRTA